MSRKPLMPIKDVHEAAKMVKLGLRTDILEARFHVTRQVIYASLRRAGYNLKELKREAQP